MDATNSANLCSFLSRGVFSIQGLTCGTQGLIFKELANNKKKKINIKEVFKD
jgi:hypothetical protein